jgi:hypothetical protein
MAQVHWEDDGVGCGGQHLAASRHDIRAGVHSSSHGGLVECQIWTPGCAFEPRRTFHASIEAAKAHAESELRALDPVFFAGAQVAA